MREIGAIIIFLSKPSGHVSILIVGGALEALEGHRKEIRLVLNRRKGFIKLALRFGVDLVPTFSFGEQFIYEQADNAKGYNSYHLILGCSIK